MASPCSLLSTFVLLILSKQSVDGRAADCKHGRNCARRFAPLAFIRRARAAFLSSRALGNAMCCPRARREARACRPGRASGVEPTWAWALLVWACVPPVCQERRGVLRCGSLPVPVMPTPPRGWRALTALSMSNVSSGVCHCRHELAVIAVVIPADADRDNPNATLPTRSSRCCLQIFR